jgi:hypothetical protein
LIKDKTVELASTYEIFIESAMEKINAWNMQQKDEIDIINELSPELVQSFTSANPSLSLFPQIKDSLHQLDATFSK